MENYFVINGEKIPMSEETAKNLISKIKKVKTYEDVARHLFDGNYCYFISANGGIFRVMILEDENSAIHPNNAPTEEQAESILALNKLANVAKYLNGDWNAYEKHDVKWKLHYSGTSDKIKIIHHNNLLISGIYFKTKEFAKRAIEILGEEEVKKALILNH